MTVLHTVVSSGSKLQVCRVHIKVCGTLQKRTPETGPEASRPVWAQTGRGHAPLVTFCPDVESKASVRSRAKIAATCCCSSATRAGGKGMFIGAFGIKNPHSRNEFKELVLRGEKKKPETLRPSADLIIDLMSLTDVAKKLKWRAADVQGFPGTSDIPFGG
ncbi:hypothetical protein LZ30DRAFT_316710 [Colletotrichum cereale]|nr:hypothetical protein LZ30DRAFT_316710 [Colletotrichum cereale]